jgi:hypothetical protein
MSLVNAADLLSHEPGIASESYVLTIARDPEPHQPNGTVDCGLLLGQDLVGVPLRCKTAFGGSQRDSDAHII